MKIKKNEKQRIDEILSTVVFSNKVVDISTVSEHRVAEYLVKEGQAEVVAKKNYGRIAQLIQFTKTMSKDQRLFPISERHFRRIWDTWRPVKKGGHCLRHTFGVRLYKETRDVNTVKHALGHRSIRSTMIYLDFVEATEKLKGAVEGMWKA